MKKTFTILLLLYLICLFTACGSEADVPETQATHTIATDIQNETLITEPTVPETTVTETVQIIFPASMFEDTDMSTFNIDDFVASGEYIDGKLNEDGSVTVTITKTMYNELMEYMTTSMEENFAEICESEDTPYIKEITHNEGFTKITMKVVRSEYENSFDMTPFALGIAITYFQVYLNMEIHCEVSVVDFDTNEVINFIVFPDAFEDMDFS